MTDSTVISSTTHSDLVQAETNLADAEALVAQLEAAVVAGDSEVTPEQIDAQSSLARFARLRVEGTRRALADSKEAARLEQIRAVRKTVEESATASAVHLADIYDTVIESLLTFVKAVEDRNDMIRSASSRLLALGAEPVSASGAASPANQFGIAPYSSHDGGRRIRLHGRALNATAAEVHIERAVAIVGPTLHPHPGARPIGPDDNTPRQAAVESLLKAIEN